MENVDGHLKTSALGIEHSGGARGSTGVFFPVFLRFFCGFFFSFGARWGERIDIERIAKRLCVLGKLRASRKACIAEQRWVSDHRHE